MNCIKFSVLFILDLIDVLMLKLNYLTDNELTKKLLLSIGSRQRSLSPPLIMDFRFRIFVVEYRSRVNNQQTMDGRRLGRTDKNNKICIH